MKYLLIACLVGGLLGCDKEIKEVRFIPSEPSAHSLRLTVPAVYCGRLTGSAAVS